MRLMPTIAEPPPSELSILSCLIAYNEFGGYCIPKSSIHRPAVQHILRGEVWERETINFITSNIREGDVIHAGTYFGDFLPALSASCARDSTIWAFEPNPENFRCATVTTIINDLRNVRLINAGLGDTEKIVAMATQDGSGRGLGGASRVITSTDSRPPESIENVQIVAIDDVVPSDRVVSIIHLDVEGYEKEALCGAKNTIRRCHPILILETLPENRWFADSILSMGYELSRTANVNKILTFPSDRC